VPRRRGQSCAAGRYCPWPARGQHHGILQAVQRADPGPERHGDSGGRDDLFADRTFTFITKTPPAPNLLLKEAGIEKGSASPNRNKVGKVTRAQLKKIAEIKMADLNASDMESAMRMIAGTARSMGLEVAD
jgi:hypothetical protein